jgi:hypothetical protein
VHAAGKAQGAAVTVNDVVLSLTAAGLRRWLARAGAAPGDLRVQVPVSLHDPGEDPHRLGNRDSFMFIDVPLGEPDPIARLRAIAAATSNAKRHHDADALHAFFSELGSLSRSAERIARRWTESPRVFGLNVSNVPGPRGDRYVLGRPLTALHSIAEVGNRHALRVSVVSAAGLLSFGICADAVAVGDTAPIAEGIREELTALRARS